MFLSFPGPAQHSSALGNTNRREATMDALLKVLTELLEKYLGAVFNMD